MIPHDPVRVRCERLVVVAKGKSYTPQSREPPALGRSGQKRIVALDAVLKLNRALEGSPYALPDDEAGADRARYLLEQCRSIERDYRNVSADFALQREDLRQRVNAMFRVQEVYESNALELAGLDLAETEEIVGRAGNTVDELTAYMAEQAVRNDRHLLEVLGLDQALLFAHQLATDFVDSRLPIREVDVRNLHRFTLPYEDHAGTYKAREVAIVGSSVTPSSVLDASEHVRQLVSWLNEREVTPALEAAVIHSWLTIIHPFEDGNGRVARLLANIVLLKAGWPSLIIRHSDRLQYLDALGHSDEAGDVLPLFELFVKSIKRSLKDLKGPKLARELFEADLRRYPDQRYEVWCELFSDFMTTLRERLGELGYEIQRLGVPPASTFHLLEALDATGNTWVGKVRRAHRHRTEFLLWLGVATVEMRNFASGDVRGGPSLFVSERDDRPGAVHPYRRPWDFTRLRVDELLIVPNANFRVQLRYGTATIEKPVADAAEMLADDIASAQDRGKTASLSTS